MRTTSVISDCPPVHTTTFSGSSAVFTSPDGFVAEIVYTTVSIVTVVVPLIMPLAASSTRPSGSAGCTLKLE